MKGQLDVDPDGANHVYSAKSIDDHLECVYEEKRRLHSPKRQ